MSASALLWLCCYREVTEENSVCKLSLDDRPYENRLSAYNTSMDKGLTHEKMHQVLKTEQVRHPLPGRGVSADQWDSVESDTESLAQERAYQQQLHMCTDQNKYLLLQMMNADSLQDGLGDDEDSSDNETENLQVYDSLEVEAHPPAERNPTLLQTECVDTQIDEREGTSQLLSSDAYSDLRYDPNWRTNLKGAGRFDESPQVSVEEYYQVTKEKSGQACFDKQGLVMKGGYRYIVDTSPAAAETPDVASSQSDRPYRLHPQDGQNRSITSSHCDNPALQPESSEADLSRPLTILTENESDNITQRGFREKGGNNPGENICMCPEMTEDAHAVHLQGLKTSYGQERRHTQGGATQIQTMSMPTLSSPNVLLNTKPQELTEDIVERNKKTLGRNTSKCGSYLRVHALKQDIPHNVNKVHETPKETDSTESQEDSSHPKLRWLQKAQQLRVTHISKGKKAQWKEHPNPPQQQQPLVPGVRAERGDCLSSPFERPAAVTQPKPQKTTSSQPLPPTLHLNINLNTSSHLLPLLQHTGQDALINIASLHACPHWSPATEAELGLSPGYKQTHPGKPSQMCRNGANAQLHHRNLENSPEQQHRTTAFKWPSSCEGEDQWWDPNKLHIKEFPQNLPRVPTTASSLGSSSYAVLPPIGKPATGKDPKLSPGQSENTAHPIHRSSSDSYLVQMEKQKQLRARVTYKAYSLKDYKQLKSDVNLRGLGPDYKAIEKTKMKRQRLYSNVIREQNKKISRIPFLPAKDPEGSDKKVPRMKALEYAKTIVKPPVQCQPKQRQKQQSKDFTEYAPSLEGLDESQPETLEVLRKRHEEEKKAVALFRKLHAV